MTKFAIGASIIALTLVIALAFAKGGRSSSAVPVTGIIKPTGAPVVRPTLPTTRESVGQFVKIPEPQAVKQSVIIPSVK